MLEELCRDAVIVGDADADDGAGVDGLLTIVDVLARDDDDDVDVDGFETDDDLDTLELLPRAATTSEPDPININPHRRVTNRRFI